jgi:hypothetical protein
MRTADDRLTFTARQGRIRSLVGRGLGLGLLLVALLVPARTVMAGPDETPGGSGNTLPWWTRWDVPVPPDRIPGGERVRQSRLKESGILEIDNDGMRGAWPPGKKGKRPRSQTPPGGQG